MPQRYRLSPWLTQWNFNGQVLQADADGFITPSTPEQEAALLAAGGQAESSQSILGPYSTADALEVANPAANYDGQLAIVGTAAPFDLYESDGSVWRVRGSKAKAQDFGSTSGARAINCAKGTFCAMTITGATTLSFTNGPSYNSSIRMTLNITNGGSNITWPAGTRWAGPGAVGSAPTLATTGTDKVVMEISNIAGTTYYDAAYVGRLA